MAFFSYFLLLLWSTATFASVWTGIDYNANYLTIAFSNNASVGPDGPWWFIPQAIDYPDETVKLIPSLTRTSLAINSSACSAATAHCPSPSGTLWTLSGADQVTDALNSTSGSIGASAWAPDLAALMNLQGSGSYIGERMTLHDKGDPNEPAFLDFHAVMISNGYAATFPGGASYTLNTGFLSLYGSEQTISWAAANGTDFSFNRTLPDAYTAGYIPSISYGLHVGSVSPNVTASLIMGGYDSSRCLTEPIVSDGTNVQLVGIAVNVSSGGSAFSNSTSGYVPGLLQVNGSQVSELDVGVGPGVPYMYLPTSTCQAIASLLPVTYNADFNLYFWDTEAPAYEQIVSSPHYLAFTLASSVGQKTQTINVPFAQLNLTLEWPLVSTPTPYFPCSPWDNTASANYHLGRAFLQSAFLAQNWQTGKKFLAQAPGPALSIPSNVKTIAHTDTTIVPATSPPDWASTWSTTLKDLPINSTQTPPKPKSTSKGISTGALAGIVVGCVAVVALVAALVFRQWRSRGHTSRGGDPTESASGYPHLAPGPQPPGYHDPSTRSPEMKAVVPAVYEADGAANSRPAEMEAHEAALGELWSPVPAKMEVDQEPVELEAQQQYSHVR